MSLSVSWKRSLSFFCGRLVRRTADFRFFARLAITSPVNRFGNACPCCVRSKVPIGADLARRLKRMPAANFGPRQSVASSAHRGHDRGGSKSSNSLTATAAFGAITLTNTAQEPTTKLPVGGPQPMRTYHRQLNAAARAPPTWEAAFSDNNGLNERCVDQRPSLGLF